MDNIEFEKVMFGFKKAIKISSLMSDYYNFAKNYNFIGMLHCLTQAEVVSTALFVPGINNSLDRLWLNRACNQIIINLMGVDYV